jgi:hypothetical protein
MPLEELLQQVLEDKSIKSGDEFERWLESAIDKAPEYEPLDLIIERDCTLHLC